MKATHADNPGEAMETASIGLDGVLLALGVITVALAWKVWGEQSGHRYLIFFALGLVLLSLVHLLETLMFRFLGFLGAEFMELVHRMLVLAGFLWLVYGLARIGATLLDQSRRLQQSHDAILQVLSSALDLRDQATEGHSRRVAQLTVVIAEQAGLPEEDVELIEHAGILHDIGKIGVLDSVLSKPGPLTDREWEEMRRHPCLGYRIIQGISFLREAAQIVHAHHERYDGRGYPRGLAGEDIPVGARLFSMADAYDAMTSNRPYGKALSHREAVTEIVRNSGTQFDPAAVQAFLAAERRGLIPPAPASIESVPSRSEDEHDQLCCPQLGGRSKLVA